MKTSKTKTKKRPTEDEKKKIEAAVKGLANATEKVVEVGMPIGMAIHIMRQVYVAKSFLAVLDKIKNELEHK